MEYTHILLRYGELFLKGKNRMFFENRLASNINKLIGIKVQRIQGRLIAPFFTEHDKLKRVFGLTSYSLAVKTEKDIEMIKSAAVKLAENLQGTFKVETQRSDKRFPMTSPEINREVGKTMEEKTSLRFAMKDAEYLVRIEINQDGVYLFLETISCFGGLPAGVEGKVLVLVEGEESILAGLLMLKRGCFVLPVGFNVFEIYLLKKYSPLKLEFKKFKNFKELEEFAVGSGYSILVSGQNYDNYQKYETNLLVVRPLIAYDDKDILEQLNLFCR
ncbi:hypothetical protein HYX11_01965 [Candidatus Woesearchaeota archaeon]|nr:hypothetical protein [Candidatus Woesearchaeota archaeon]